MEPHHKHHPRQRGSVNGHSFHESSERWNGGRAQGSGAAFFGTSPGNPGTHSPTFGNAAQSERRSRTARAAHAAS